MIVPVCAVVLAAAAVWGGAQLDPDCTDETRTRQRFERARLFEIHEAQETLRSALTRDLGLCAAGAAGSRCRDEALARFEGAWVSRKAEIQVRYEMMLSDLEERCRASLT